MLEGTTVPRPRIQTLTDLIFGLALSISAIVLIGTVPQNHFQFLGSIAYFAFSFIILINIWTRYTSIVSLVPIETSAMMRLNIILLFLVALEPYLFNLLNVTAPTSFPSFGQEVSQGLAVDLGGMTMIIAYFAHVLTREDRRLVPKELLGRYRLRRNLFVFAALIFFFSAVPQFWVWTLAGQPLRIWLWLTTFPVSLARSISTSRVEKADRPDQPHPEPQKLDSEEEDFTKKWLG